MKKVSILLAAVFAVTTLLVSWAESENAAVVINDIGCILMDGDGNLVATDNTHAVVTSSGNGMLTCRAEVPNSTGKAVVYKDLGCNTPAGFGIGRETVSTSGQATLTCWVKAE